MNTHSLQALCPDGRRFEVARVASIEKAARLRSGLANELGDEYVAFEIVELEVDYRAELARMGLIHVTSRRFG